MTDREIMQMALDALTHGCPPDCKNGMTDSGGVLTWGEPALVPCPTCATISALRERLAEPEQEPKAVITKAAETAPKEIWLQIGDEPEHLDEPFPYGQDVTWCQESVLQAEVRYIRADIDARRPARELSDEEIDLMAESVIASMDNGLRGFLKTWGWRQFARAILARARGEK